MPKVGNTRIGTGDGQLGYKTNDASQNTPAATNSQKPAEQVTISGNNLGFGHGLFSGVNGTNKLRIDFRSLVAGKGITLTDDSETITITSTETANLTLESMSGTLSVSQGGTGRNSLNVNGVMVGNGAGPVRTIASPVGSMTQMLVWDGVDFKWSNVPDAMDTGATIVASSSPAITVNQGYNSEGDSVYTLGFSSTGLNLNSFSGVLDVAKGGTGSSNFTLNGLVVGNSGGALTSTPAPTASNQSLVWTGSAYTWRSVGSVTSVGVSAGSSKVVVSNSPITTNGVITIDVDPTQIAITSLMGTLSVAKGGTGLTALGTSKQMLRVNAAGTALEYATITTGDVAGLSAVATTGAYADIVGKPTLATVATTGSYTDLSNRPTLTNGTVTSVGVTSASNKLSVTGSTVTTSGSFVLDVNEANLNLNNQAGILSVAKGGTGLATTVQNGVMVGGVANSVGFTSAPSTPGTMLTWNGSAFAWTLPPTGTAGTVTSVGLIAASDKITVLGNTITANGSFTIDVDESKLNLANLGGTLASSKVTGFATVASTGSYSDLTNKPSIPAPYVLPTASSTVIGGVKIGSGITLDAEGAIHVSAEGAGTVTSVAINAGSTRVSVTGSPITSNGTITVDVNEANLNIGNMGGTIDAAKLTGLATVANSGSYNDLINKPFIPTQYTDTQARASISATGSLTYDPVTGVMHYAAPTLSTVATSGSYNDLADKPTIPAAYNLPHASSNVLGGIKIGSGLTIDAEGVVNVIASGSEGSTGSGTVTSVALAAGSSKVSVSGSPITASGTLTVDVVESNLSIANMTGSISTARVTGLATVATSGSYADLSNKPTIPAAYTDTQARAAISATGSLSYNSTTGVISYTAPVLATVATSGSYNDLADKPTIPAAYTDAQARSAISAGGALSYNSATGVMSYTAPVLATVALTGNYADLINKPAAYSLPTASDTVLGGVKVGNGLVIDGNGVLSLGAGAGSGTVTSVGLTAGSSRVSVSNSPITASGNITVDVIEANMNIANMTGSILSNRVTGLATVATSGSYNDLSNKPTIPAAYSDAQARAAISVNGSLSYDPATGVISYTAPVLATVATSGSYNDLTNKPSIPAAYTDAQARAAISINAGSSGATYNSTTGVLDLSALTAGTGGGEGGSSTPAGATDNYTYIFSSVMNAGNVTANGTDAATIGISNLPAGWSASSASGTTTITHNVGRPPRSVVFYVGTASTTNPVYVMVPGGNTAATGLVKMAASGSLALNTTTFQYQLASSMATIANGTVYIMVTF